ncbi:hypothetical protein AB1Y20_008377 [Prymnesium parvum]|uniref:BioF2-like acetyltransferase domain-containing protein n=1 Tax=Prymnesium parvum TaxID=97485 RepID=A0AB34IR91_PRYPA
MGAQPWRMWAPHVFIFAAAAAHVMLHGEMQRIIRRHSLPRADIEGPSELRARGVTLESTDIALTVHRSIAEVDRGEWDTSVGRDSAGRAFQTWDFLSHLEGSGSAHIAEGWAPRHLVARDQVTGELLGAVACYLKDHSHGEYVFDQAWARAYSSISSPPSPRNYYPKLQVCTPFTPVSGPRLHVAPGPPAQQAAVRRALCRGLKQLSASLGTSSVHVTFASRADAATLRKEGFLLRYGLQYHWRNRGFCTFDDFLMALKQSRRRSVRRERRKVKESGLRILRLRGAQIEGRHLRAFECFYMDTVERHAGTSYLKPGFFAAVTAAMREQILLVVAEDSRSGELVAGALNFVGSDCIYGRYWGCSRQHDSLHFELCYYQVIEEAIALGLPRVEAGAQGEHKIARGYMPTLTYAAVQVADGNFRQELERFLEHERERTFTMLAVHSMRKNPFRGEPADHLRSQGIELRGDRLEVVRY